MNDDFRADQRLSPVEAAKHSLREAERATMRDELLLGILQSNIAIAEALSAPPLVDREAFDAAIADASRRLARRAAR